MHMQNAAHNSYALLTLLLPDSLLEHDLRNSLHISEKFNNVTRATLSTRVRTLLYVSTY